jgi:hypothetical protein
MNVPDSAVNVLPTPGEPARSMTIPLPVPNQLDTGFTISYWRYLCQGYNRRILCSLLFDALQTPLPVISAEHQEQPFQMHP